jgi:FkbM family methyltransferase
MFQQLPHSPAELYHQMIAECLTALKLNTFLDNYDAERFSFDGVDRSMTFDAHQRANQFIWFFENHLSIYEAFKILGDEYSKRIYLCTIAYRLAGFHSVRIPVDFNENSEDFKKYVENEKFTDSELKIDGLFGKLKHYDFQFEGIQYLVDCLGLKYYLYRKQYFYNHEGVSIEPRHGDYIIDGGACLGDTAIIFGNKVGKEGCVYCFDPIWDHLQVLEYNSKQNPDLNIKVMPYGLSDIDYVCEPLKLNVYNPGFNAANNKLPMHAIDSLVIKGDIQRVDFIKLDVEGSELAALKGATGTIRKFNPKMGISLYHKPNDIFEIPLYIKNNFPNYNIYISHYTIHNEETVMYCSV